VRKTNVWYLFAVDATGKKIRGQADGKVNDYDQYGKLTFGLIHICQTLVYVECWKHAKYQLKINKEEWWSCPNG